jgi:thioredoxin 1
MTLKDRQLPARWRSAAIAWQMLRGSSDRIVRRSPWACEFRLVGADAAHLQRSERALLQADLTAPNLRAEVDSAEMGCAFRTARITHRRRLSRLSVAQARPRRAPGGIPGFWRVFVSDHIAHVTDDQFEDQVLKSSDPVLVDFWAEWCGPCKMIAPILDDLAASYQGRLKVAKINIDHNQKTPRNYNVRGIPTLMIFKDGKVQATQIGAVSKTQLTQIIDKAIAQSASALPASH